jgi:hypothetical protein
VFEVVDRLVEQLSHVAVVEAIADVLALTDADDQIEVTQHAELV